VIFYSESKLIFHAPLKMTDPDGWVWLEGKAQRAFIFPFGRSHTQRESKATGVETQLGEHYKQIKCLIYISICFTRKNYRCSFAPGKDRNVLRDEQNNFAFSARESGRDDKRDDINQPMNLKCDKAAKLMPRKKRRLSF
jgi:hypothetical protein